MKGLASKLYFERKGTHPFEVKSQKESILQKLLDDKILEPIDVFTAEALQIPEENMKLIIALLSLAARNGFLYLDLSNLTAVDPRIASLQNLISDGLTIIPQNAPLKRRENRLYFSKHLQNENGVRSNLKRFKKVTLVHGLAGTGKTYFGICQVKNSLSSCWVTAQDRDCLQLEYTLHGISPYTKVKSVWEVVRDDMHIYEDVVVIDDVSRISQEALFKILSCVKDDAELFLIGDLALKPLPEAGFLFADLIKEYPLIELKDFHRQKNRLLYEALKALAMGNKSAIEPFCNFSSDALEIILSYWPKKIIGHPSIEEFFSLLNRVCLFTLDTFETRELNHNIAKEAMKQTNVIPIVLKSGDVHLGFKQGERGLLLNSDEALFLEKNEGSYHLRKCPEAILPPYEPAFVMNPLMALGLEFDHVITLISKNRTNWTSSLLYSAASRAKNNFIFI